MNSFQSGNVIRVYPFVVEVPVQVYQSLEFRGSEHDEMKWITFSELETLSPTVPALVAAFHHATRGKYCTVVEPNVKEWANDRVSGAATMAHQALQIIRNGASPTTMKMLRPSMVAITNVLQRLESNEDTSMLFDEIQTSLAHEAERTVELAVTRITAEIQQHEGTSFVIGVFSRSSTLLSILKRIEKMHNQKVEFVCSQSTPGDEGILMSKDLGRAKCVTDAEMLQQIQLGSIYLVLVGCDCVMDEFVVNKVGTSDLAIAAHGSCPIFCCSDRWKIWGDKFPPPLEPIFEQIPRSLFDEILLPSPL